MSQHSTNLLSCSSVGEKADLGLSGLKSRCFLQALQEDLSSVLLSFCRHPHSLARGCSLPVQSQQPLLKSQLLCVFSCAYPDDPGWLPAFRSADSSPSSASSLYGLCHVTQHVHRLLGTGQRHYQGLPSCPPRVTWS